jgi:hypothetical protein
MKGFRGDSALSDIELEELLAQKALDRGITHRLLPLVRPVRRLIAGVIAIEIVQVLAIFARPLLIGLVIDKGLRHAGGGGGILPLWPGPAPGWPRHGRRVLRWAACPSMWRAQLRSACSTICASVFLPMCRA